MELQEEFTKKIKEHQSSFSERHILLWEKEERVKKDYERLIENSKQSYNSRIKNLEMK